MVLGRELGPLEPLAGEWEGDEGVDAAFSHSQACMVDTPYRERATFSPFGPVQNGNQVLYGLDYRTAAWRSGEDEPFHTEVGYWLWDGETGQVMRCFMVPRGSTLLAGGLAEADARTFSLQAELGSETYGILSNPYLHTAARTTLYQVTVELTGDSFVYRSTTIIEHNRVAEPIAHTDTNRLRRVR